jgi:hypothetical protein
MSDGARPPQEESTLGRVGDAVEHGLDDLLLDRIDALRVFRADNQEQKGELLEQIA